MDKDQIDSLAEKIALIISAEYKTPELSSLQKSMEEVKARLDTMETGQKLHPSSFIPHPFHTHPSQDRFNIAEAIADEVFAKPGKEKACTFEPNDKPCDHCAMCSSRGF